MKKLSIYMMALLALGFASCDDDFATETEPQKNAQESALQLSDVSVATGVNAINIAELTSGENGEEPIKIGTVTINKENLPSNAVLTAEVEFSTDADFESSITVKAQDFDESYDINVSPTTLQDAYFNNITRNPATATMYVRTILYVLTEGESYAVIGSEDGIKYFDVHTVTLTPLNKVQISQAYYIVGGPNSDWAGSAAAKSIKFTHSDEDVYVDPIFTVIFDAAEGDTWFAIGDDAACEAIAGGDWSQLLGVVGGDSQATEGKLDFRYNMGADNSFCVPAGAKKIRVTLDMLNYTFKVEPVSIADAYYLIGGPGEWNAESAMTMQFSHSNKDVFEDPVFTYTFEGTGGDMWFAFGDKEAIDGVAEGTWNKLYGTLGESTDLSGSFDRRYNLDGDHSFCVDGKAKFYRFTINMSDMTYSIAVLNFAEYIWEAGVNNEWGAIEQPLYCGDGNGTYTGYFYAQDADWSGGMGAFKFTGAFNDWSQGNYGAGTCTDEGGTLIDSSDSDNLLATPGFYRAIVNMATMTYELTKIEYVSVIGDGGDWETDKDLTYNIAERCWEGTLTLAGGDIKFRGNHKWADDLDLGGSFDALVPSGSNIAIEAGTYNIKLYITCENKHYAVVTKQ